MCLYIYIYIYIYCCFFHYLHGPKKSASHFDWKRNAFCGQVNVANLIKTGIHCERELRPVPSHRGSSPTECHFPESHQEDDAFRGIGAEKNLINLPNVECGLLRADHVRQYRPVIGCTAYVVCYGGADYIRDIAVCCFWQCV